MKKKYKEISREFDGDLLTITEHIGDSTTRITRKRRCKVISVQYEHEQYFSPVGCSIDWKLPKEDSAPNELEDIQRQLAQTCIDPNLTIIS